MQAPALTPLAAAALHVGMPERVLVVDCRDGQGALFLAREFPQASIRGIDPSEEAVRRATARIGLDPEGRVAFKVGRGRSIPFPTDHFDLLAILDSRPRVAEIARVLRPSGHLILASSDRSNPSGGPLLRWNLAHRGFKLVCAEPAGDGAFSVHRL
jgi:SAM-dependent methyltransferase